MSNIISGRARVVYISDEFVHLSKGGLDGKIVAFKDSWLAANYDLQDWVTFKAKSYEAVSSLFLKLCLETVKGMLLIIIVIALFEGPYFFHVFSSTYFFLPKLV